MTKIPMINSSMIKNEIIMGECRLCLKYSLGLYCYKTKQICFHCLDSILIDSTNMFTKLCTICDNLQMVLKLSKNRNICINCHKILRSIALGEHIGPYIYIENGPSLSESKLN